VTTLLDHWDDYPIEIRIRYSVECILFSFLTSHLTIAPTHLNELSLLIVDMELNQSKSVKWNVLLRHTLQVQTNAIAILNSSSNSFSNNSRSFSQSHHRIGLGLFPSLSLLNHSCNPNAILNYRGRTIVSRSTDKVLILI
jgi:hypothetical protein